MLLTMQFPIADARRFLKKGNPILSLYRLQEEGSFVRCFGKLTLRKNKDQISELPLDWAKDINYVSAKAALKVPNLGQYYEFHQKIRDTDPPSFLLKPSYLSRRLFFNTSSVVRVEIGLKVESPVTLDKKQCLSVIKDYLTLPTKVPSFTGKDGYSSNYLINQGSALSRLFLHATTPNVKTTDLDANSVISCAPVLFFEYSENSKSLYDKPIYESILPHDAKKIDAIITNNVNLSYYEYRVSGRSCAVWFIGCNEDNKENVRLLKLCLLRLHAEQQALKNIVLFVSGVIDEGLQDNLKIDDLNSYLSCSTKAIFKKKSYGIFQSKILDAVKQCESNANKSELIFIENNLVKLEEQLKSIVRRQTMEKIRYFIGDLATKIGGIMPESVIMSFGDIKITQSQIASHHIQNSFEISENADSYDLKAELKTLSANIENLCKNIKSHDEQEQISRELERFTNEAVTQNPNKSFLEFSGKNLVDAAKTFAEFSGAIAKSVAVILGLLK